MKNLLTLILSSFILLSACSDAKDADITDKLGDLSAEQTTNVDSLFGETTQTIAEPVLNQDSIDAALINGATESVAQSKEYTVIVNECHVCNDDNLISRKDKLSKGSKVVLVNQKNDYKDRVEALYVDYTDEEGNPKTGWINPMDVGY